MNNRLPKAEPDFLQRLVSKALEDDSAIEPRLPSLFEPASVSSLDAGLAWQDESVYVADQAVEGRSGDGAAGRTQAKAYPTPDVPNAAATPRRADPMPLAEQFDPRPMPSPSQAASAEHLPPNAVDVVIRELHPPAGDVTPFEGRRPIAGHDYREESLPRAAGRDRSGIDERTNPPVRTDLDDTRGTLVPVSTAVAQRIVVAPQAAPYRPPDEAPAGQADAAPVVNVTIGRLEVRAMPAAATAKPRSERHGAQPMTLDDYFKQRRGER
jgi:hypothetical protein